MPAVVGCARPSGLVSSSPPHPSSSASLPEALWVSGTIGHNRGPGAWEGETAGAGDQRGLLSPGGRGLPRQDPNP